MKDVGGGSNYEKTELATHFVVSDKKGRFFLASDSRFPIVILFSQSDNFTSDFP